MIDHNDYLRMLPDPPAIHGEQVAGESAVVRDQLEALINNRNASTFDIGSLLHQVRKHGYHTEWGFSTFLEYRDTLKISRRVAEYSERIADVMGQVGIPRTQYEPLGIARLRLITRLKPQESWTNPETNDVTPMREFIVGFIEKGDEIPFKELAEHVRTLKGEIGENDRVFRTFCFTRLVSEQTIDPALELTKNFIGSVGKDEDGISQDASDSACVEVWAVNYLNDSNNHVLAETA